MKIDWKRTWRLADVNSYAARFTLILAVVHVVLVIAGDFQGKDTGDNALWILGFAACSLGFRALARLDTLAHELRVRAAHAEKVNAAAHHRLNDLEVRVQATFEQILIMEREARG